MKAIPTLPSAPIAMEYPLAEPLESTVWQAVYVGVVKDKPDVKLTGEGPPTM